MIHWWWSRRRRADNARVTEVHRRADKALREAREGRVRGAELADRLERRGDCNSFGESMIDLIRGYTPDDGTSGGGR
jgi:hypothetical protein